MTVPIFDVAALESFLARTASHKVPVIATIHPFESLLHAELLKKRGHVLSLGSGLQRWLFPSVKTGSNDWLLPGNLLYQGKMRRFGLMVSSDSWSLLSSSLPTGSLVHTQVWQQFTLRKRERLDISFRHGPAHTYSWNFYGTHGNRVLRYQTMLAITLGNTSIEGGIRRQWGLQKGIPDNTYWQFSLIQVLRHRFPD